MVGIGRNFLEVKEMGVKILNPVIDGNIERITLYVCKICGNTSMTYEEIEECVKKGSPYPKYLIGEDVEFLFAPRGVNRWLKAKVGGIVVQKGTHTIDYLLIIDPVTQKEMGHRVDETSSEVVGVYKERDIRPARKQG
jgi:hypothetical protein